MRQPAFEEIWLDSKWLEYRLTNHPDHSRRYFKLRSLVRVAIWMPIGYVSVLGIMFFAGLLVGAWN